MRSPTYFKIRAIVRALFWIGLVAGIYLVASHLNWTGAGYCWGTIDQCYLEGGK
jgi:hypothetical protein